MRIGDINNQFYIKYKIVAHFRQLFADEQSPMVISGCVGPYGDGYQVDEKLRVKEAAAYHGEQIRTFKEAGADLVSALTINYSEEAIGIVLAAQKHDIPAVISFTVLIQPILNID